MFEILIWDISYLGIFFEIHFVFMNLTLIISVPTLDFIKQ